MHPVAVSTSQTGTQDGLLRRGHLHRLPQGDGRRGRLPAQEQPIGGGGASAGGPEGGLPGHHHQPGPPGSGGRAEEGRGLVRHQEQQQPRRGQAAHPPRPG